MRPTGTLQLTPDPAGGSRLSGRGLDVHSVTVRYGGFRAVDSVSFSVTPGAIVGLIGPNGAGKTSCFDAICGYVDLTAGEVRVDGQSLPPGDPIAAWWHGIGRTFQRPELFWDMTPVHHVELAARFARGIGRDFAYEPEDCLGLVGCDARWWKEVVAALPLGALRQVELARAFATVPQVLLLDEPCSGLDALELHEIVDAIDRLRQEVNCAVLLVEHDMDVVMRLADELVVMDFGRVIASGSPRMVARDPAVVHAYLGEAENSEGGSEWR